MSEKTDKFILVRKSKLYNPASSHPKVSTDKGTYNKLKRIALENGLSISEVLRQIVDYAEDHIDGIVEE